MKIIYVNIRSDYGGIIISNGFLSVISKTKVTKLKYILLGFKIKSSRRLNVILESLLEVMVNLFSEEVITLVVDEANLPLTIYDYDSIADRDEVKTTLALFTKLTKQENKDSAPYLVHKYYILFILF